MFRMVPALFLLAAPLEVGAQEFVANATKRVDPHFYEDRVEVSAESGVLFNVGSNATKAVAPQILSIRWQLDEVGNEGWRRGNTEWVFSGDFYPVLEGVESRFTGGLFGPRYNFVQPDSKWVPFVGARVGFGFTDSRYNQAAQGQDFMFTFSVETGVRYLVTERLDVSFMAFYQHFSNADLSEPERENNGLDVLGPMVSLHWRF